ncbi:MBL fold metallo-hydrolase [Alphaproteobacteria bacterium]|nr:MBL fold metallo-hydrolase [Alphaproteobacteria bacterium]
MIGLKTIGNATIIAYDSFPIIATDPWLNDDEAYFGSWSLSHRIPKEIENDIFKSKYIWFSHGHPDHLNPHSIKKFYDKKILLPDHVGARIFKWLKKINYKVEILKDRKWLKLSEKISVMSIADYNQDAILLINLNGRLFINCNDATIRNCRSFIRKISKEFEKSYLLSLSGYGDADMINIFDEDGKRIPPAASFKNPVGKSLSEKAKILGANHVIPFSSFHKYTREDSIWAQKYTTPIDVYNHDFDHDKLKFINPFSLIDCQTNEILSLDTKKNPELIYKASDFGDNWSEQLTSEDVNIIKKYFFKLELLKEKIGFISFKVGKQENNFYLNKKIKNGIIFEVPRTSLIKAIKYEIFDDLLIGNFMKTTFHGKKINSLYDMGFNPIVPKYADNGRVFSKVDYAKYMKEYRLRSEGEWLKEYFERITSQLFRKYVHYDSKLYNFGRKSFNKFRKYF